MASASSDFVTTQWSLLLSARPGISDGAAREALEHLATRYWYPLYAYIRRRGHSAPDAEDLTQEFLSQFIEKRFLDDVDPERGRFRSFLLACVNHFLANQYDRARAQKRGSGKPVVSLESAECRYAGEADTMTPERLFERRWALALLDSVLARLADEYAHQESLFGALKETLISSDAPPYAAIARDLDMTEAAIKTAAHRLRRRFRELFKQQIGQTVSGPGEIAEEIAYLKKCL